MIIRFDLERFVAAQDEVWRDVVAELSSGRKRSHWMWFVFPQLAGLGRSAMAAHYALRSLDEATAFASHGVLGPRLRQVTELALAVPGRSADDIFGAPDDMKFRSSMTLFDAAVPADDLFRRALARFFDRAPDAATLRLLGR